MYQDLSHIFVYVILNFFKCSHKSEVKTEKFTCEFIVKSNYRPLAEKQLTTQKTNCRMKEDEKLTSLIMESQFINFRTLMFAKKKIKKQYLGVKNKNKM